MYPPSIADARNGAPTAAPSAMRSSRLRVATLPIQSASSLMIFATIGWRVLVLIASARNTVITRGPSMPAITSGMRASRR
jgi:hypothetical protein